MELDESAANSRPRKQRAKPRPKIRPGDKFGKLTVAELAAKSEWGAPSWRCQCACGSVVVLRALCLRRALRTSCGCDRRTLADRFWERVDRNGTAPSHVVELGPCWLWTGARLKLANGALSYGSIGERKDVRHLAHRVSWKLHFGDVPEGMCVCHKCDNPQCVRPDHLFLGTQQDNMADKLAKGRAVFNRFPTGEAHPNAKADEETVRTIRELRGAGLSLAKIGARVGLHASTVHDIVRATTWRTP